MHAKLTVTALAICLLVGTIAARRASRSWFEARTAGATALTLSGTAEFGPVDTAGGAGTFVLTLGASSPTGAVLITSRTGAPTAPGVYLVGEDPRSELQALVVTGSATRPTGVYRARAGMLTITGMRRDVEGGLSAMEGRFEIDAAGFEAAAPADETRELRVRGSFTASADR
jgi:hypothetical protein